MDDHYVDDLFTYLTFPRALNMQPAVLNNTQEVSLLDDREGHTIGYSWRKKCHGVATPAHD